MTDYTPLQLIVIDPNVPQPELLLEQLPDDYQVLALNHKADAIDQITECLKDYQDVSALHIVTHGSPGALHFANAILSNDTLNQYWDQLASWSKSMGDDADILLYGCETGKGVEGSQLLKLFHEITGCNIAAASEIVGEGKQWLLSEELGSVSSLVFATETVQYQWRHHLATPTDQDFESVAEAVLGTPYILAGITYTTTTVADSGYTSVQSLGANYAITQVSDKGLYFNNNGATFDIGAAEFSIKTSDGSEFKMLKMEADGGFGQGAATSYTIKGYKDNVEAATDTIDFTTSDTNGSVSYTNNGLGGNGGLLTFNTDWQNIDEIRFTGTNVALGIDDLDFENAVMASNPTITSATYDAAIGSLVVTGTDFSATAGGLNDVIATKFTLTGEGGATYTLTDTNNAEITSATEFTLSLSATDKAAINQILNKNGTQASDGATNFDISAAAGFIADSAATADTGANVVTVANVPVPTITSATYDYSNGQLVVTGTGFLKKFGATNDIDISKLTFTGEGGGLIH